MSYEGDEEVIDPDNYDEGVSRGFIEFCRKQMGQRIPDYREAISWGGCGALYTVTPDAHALIGEVPGIDGFYLVSGFSGTSMPSRAQRIPAQGPPQLMTVVVSMVSPVLVLTPSIC